MLAMLFGCGLRRSELVGLELDEIQMRQGHWAVVDLIGKGGHIRTVPISKMGQGCARSVDGGSRGYGGKNFSSSRQDRKGVGEGYFAERRLVCRQDLLRESGLGAYCTA